MTTFLELLLFFICCIMPAEPVSSSLFPEDHMSQVSLYPLLQWNAYTGEEILCRVTDSSGHCIDGVIDIQDSTVTYYPYQMLETHHCYRFTVETPSASYTTTFTTTDVSMPNQWVEVVLGDVQKVLVWEDQKIIQAFPCSGGTAETPSILGMYSMMNRGTEFYSERVGEGARFWIRIQGNYLFHGIVRDRDGNPIPGEEEKIGTAASHGCIRLHDEDAMWLYQNLPDGTLVVIHPGLNFP